MTSTILVVLLLLVLLGGVGFFPAPAFTANHRWAVGTVLVVVFIVWLLKFSGIVVL